MRFFHLTVLFVVDAVVAGPSRCNYCVGTSASCSWISKDDQFCASDSNSLGTTHCASVVGKYLHDRKGDNVTDVFFRGCFNCSSKKEACFALGGFLRGDRRTLLQCEIECCTSDNCNNQFPALSENAITVFTPNASGPAKCYRCLAKDADACFSSQVEQTCSYKSGSLGTTHCGSGVGIFRDKDGNITRGFWRSCINCADKKAACAIVNSYYTEERFTLPECEIECCTENFCNRQLIPTKPIPATPGHPSMAPSVLGNREFHAFVLAISIFLHHF